MALDIRMDFICNIDPLYIERMSAMRKLFILIDEELQCMADEAKVQDDAAAARCVALARTANESACQSTIKALCILGEIESLKAPQPA